jgi:beta-galactosidase
VFVYTDYPEAELFVNGKSQGRIRKAFGLRVDDQNPSTGAVAKERARRYRLMWDNVVYQPGELKVVAYDAQGNAAAEQRVETAGEAVAIKLEADRQTIHADGEDLCFITVSLVDEKGVELPRATHDIKVNVTGDGVFKAMCNGDATSLESFTEPQMKLFSGKLVVVVQAGSHAGSVNVEVSAPELKLKKKIVIATK